ncbi:MAG: hypothetical protein FVQ81_02110 [Candidatus Glassbacteria bacterium]|nr:hypothetical protein [Candidatus Glassbacteria bacterium]
MRKVFLALALFALLLTAFIVVFAQNTAPVPSTFAIRAELFSLIFRPPADPRPVKKITGYFRWWNARGRTDSLVTADSSGTDTLSTPTEMRGRPVAFVRADSAAFVNRYGLTQKSWTLVITAKSDIGSDFGTVSFSTMDIFGGSRQDTSLRISSDGLECDSLFMDLIDVGFAPYDSISVGDRTIFSWVTSTWQ